MRFLKRNPVSLTNPGLALRDLAGLAGLAGHAGRAAHREAPFPHPNVPLNPDPLSFALHRIPPPRP